MWTDVALRLVQDPSVVVYFLALFYSIYYCFKHATQRWAVYAALGTVSITWFYIFRWTQDYTEAGKENLFDDAYKDVVNPPHYALSSQLLTWVVVGCVWMHEASVNYLLFGMLGAMSAAFFTWVPQHSKKSNRMIPLCYLPTSIAALWCIQKLPQTLHSDSDFHLYLLSLHVLLVLPRVFQFIAPYQPCVDGTILYTLLSLFIAIVHWSDDSIAMPETDCQWSISCDLLLCSLITAYAVYQHSGSILQMSVALFLMPITTPGIVLALYLGLVVHGKGAHGRFVTWLQKEMAQRRRTKRAEDQLWMNLGLGWNDENNDYDEACQSLAMRLGEAALEKDDAVLACGCGYGAELIFWKEAFGLKHITGVDLNEDAASSFLPRENTRLLHVPVSEIMQTFRNKACFNKIVALDSVYHYVDKEQYFKDCATILDECNTSARAMLGVTDLILRPGVTSVPMWLSLALRAMNVQVKGLRSEQAYRKELLSMGYVDIKVDSLEPLHVLDGWFPKFMQSYVDYALITAERSHGTRTSLKVLKKVAIIGSGLSGLTAAHLLSGTHNVTIFEASERGGLSGHGVSIFDQVVDVPLRIIGPGYYKYVTNLAEKLDVKLKPIRKHYLTQHNYGDNGPGGKVTSFGYTDSWFQNLLNYLPLARDIYRFNKNVFNEKSGSEGLKKSSTVETWGDWLERHGYDIARYRGDRRTKTADGTKYDSTIIWLLMGQASWMLSCTYEQVLNYPAFIILQFIEGFGWGKDVGDITGAASSESGRMMRIHPSMEALEFALSYGCTMKCRTRVSGVDESLVIDGERFDSLVIATEASAVKHILSPSIFPNSVFSQIKYQPSKIVLHTDPTLMPFSKNDWKAFNVCQSKGEDSCQLTAWLNEYYEPTTINFPEDVFQTWNPHTTPKPESVLKEVHFMRVVHTVDTPSMIKEVASLQGQHNIYYAGAYSIEGMGLLEQAARSGRKVAGLIIQHTEESHLPGTKNHKGISKRKRGGKKGAGRESEENGPSDDEDWLVIS
jgi:uncharacterized protein